MKEIKNIHIEALKDLEQMDIILHDFGLSSNAYERLKEYITFNYRKELEKEKIIASANFEYKKKYRRLKNGKINYKYKQSIR